MANQTHKTIIFEEFDSFSGKPDLYTILNNDPSGDNLSTELDKLLVKSFDEFMKNFSPKVYEVAWRDQYGNIQFLYTTDPTKFPDCPYVTFDIGEHAFYKMLSELYVTRGSRGQANIKFDDKEIMEMLTPKKELEEVRDLRRKMEYNLQLFYEAKAKGDRSEMNAARDKLTAGRKRISEYSSSPLNKLLPIIIEDINRKLEFLESNSSDSMNDDKPKALPSYGILYLNEAGQIDILDKQKRETALKALPGGENKGGSLVVANKNYPVQITTLPAKPTQNNTISPVPDKKNLQNEIAQAIVKDYEQNAEIQNEQIKSLIVSTFAPLAEVKKFSVAELDAGQLLKQKEMYEKAYAQARQSFANEMSKIVESLLGVKTFFDHATIDGDESSEIPAGVIIANCKASKLLKIRNKFASKMKHLGKDQIESRIWFAVVPCVLEEPPTFNVIEEDDDDPLSGDWNDKKISVSSGEDYVSVDALKEFIKIMNEAKIMTVFNIRVKNGNTFADLSTAEVENKIKTFEKCDYSHAVYAYPNFTLIRERNLTPFEGQQTAKITLPGVFIDAAYPAAGLLVASQQSKILDSRKLKYDKDSPCISVDFENPQVKKKLPTKFNRESILRRSEDLIKAINKNMFGFAFSGDEVRDEDGVWKNSYVYCARTLAKNKKNGNYKPIYKTLVEDYIEQSIIGLVSNKKPHVEKMLIKKINNEYAEKNGQTRYRDAVNLILREGEFLYIGNVNGKDKIFVHFSEGDDNYLDPDVESD